MQKNVQPVTMPTTSHDPKTVSLSFRTRFSGEESAVEPLAKADSSSLRSQNENVLAELSS
jgi:hypothetical protein